MGGKYTGGRERDDPLTPFPFAIVRGAGLGWDVFVGLGDLGGTFKEEEVEKGEVK